jgi:hypothetical protein
VVCSLKLVFLTTYPTDIRGTRGSP